VLPLDNHLLGTDVSTVCVGVKADVFVVKLFVLLRSYFVLLLSNLRIRVVFCCFAGRGVAVLRNFSSTLCALVDPDEGRLESNRRSLALKVPTFRTKHAESILR
jgi:hypothetical protein